MGKGHHQLQVSEMENIYNVQDTQTTKEQGEKQPSLKMGCEITQTFPKIKHKWLKNI